MSDLHIAITRLRWGQPRRYADTDHEIELSCSWPITKHQAVAIGAGVTGCSDARVLPRGTRIEPHVIEVQGLDAAPHVPQKRWRIYAIAPYTD